MLEAGVRELEGLLARKNVRVSDEREVESDKEAG